MRAIPVVLMAAALAVPVFARDNDYYGRGPRDGRSNGSWQRFGAPPVRAAIHELQAIGSRGRLSGGDREDVREALESLRRFEDRLRDGRWDKGALDRGIENVRDLSDSSRLHPRERSVLRQHLYALRDYRANGQWARR